MNAKPASNGSPPSGEFLVRKCVFLLTSSVGRAMAENLIDNALKAIHVPAANLNTSDIALLSMQLLPALGPFVGED
ncbi:MAG TPA: hypothetical protein VI756_12205, partial [Blastocatellia bacterium]